MPNVFIREQQASELLFLVSFFNSRILVLAKDG